MAAPIVTHKVCVRCSEDKPASEFYQIGKYLCKFCKVCQRKENNAIHRITRKSARPFKAKYSDTKPYHFLIPYKRCSKCSTFKGGDKFCNNARNKDGLSDWCRDCHKKRNDALKARRVEIAAQPKPPISEKVCAKCKAIKPVAEFYKNKHHSSGYSSGCKMCIESSPKRDKKQKRIRERYACKQCGAIMWRRRDYKEWRGLCRQCLQPRDEHGATAERRKVIGSGKYRAWRKGVLERDNYVCQECGSMKNLEVDHIKPWSTHVELRYEVSNGRTLCKPCHLKTDTYGGKALRFKKAA